MGSPPGGTGPDACGARLEAREPRGVRITEGGSLSARLIRTTGASHRSAFPGRACQSYREFGP
eukprot:4145788-Heterocapsa_arctica.AAC.1